MNKEIIVIGTTSKFGNYIFKHSLESLIMLCTSLAVFLLLWRETKHDVFIGVAAGLIYLLPVIFLTYLASNKWCYKIELNESDNTIIFYRLFYRAPRIFKLTKIKIVINPRCHILIEDSDFILHSEYIHDLVSYLPSDTVIEYKGWIAKYTEKHWIKGPLIPGSKRY